MTDKIISRISRVISANGNIVLEEVDFAKAQIEKIFKKEKVRQDIISQQLQNEIKINRELNRKIDTSLKEERSDILKVSILEQKNLLDEISNLRDHLDQIDNNIKKLDNFLIVLEEKKRIANLEENRFSNIVDEIKTTKSPFLYE